MGGHGSLGSVSSSFMGVTLGYPSGHPDPHSSMIARDIESQNTVSSVATDTSTSTTRLLLARQPPIGIETAAATNPTLDAQVVEMPTCDRRRPSSVTLSPPTLSPAPGFEQSQSVLLSRGRALARVL